MLRVLRGNPKGSLSVRCYRHTGCSFLLSERLAPDDDDLISWAYDVPGNEPGMSTEERKALAQRHKGLADKWRPKKKAKAAAASSNIGA